MAKNEFNYVDEEGKAEESFEEQMLVKRRILDIKDTTMEKEPRQVQSYVEELDQAVGVTVENLKTLENMLMPILKPIDKTEKSIINDEGLVPLAKSLSFQVSRIRQINQHLVDLISDIEL